MKYTIVIVSSRFLQRPQIAKSREPAYSQVLNQNKLIDSGSRSRESDSQTSMAYGVWSSEREGGMGKRMNLLKKQCFQF